MKVIDIKLFRRKIYQEVARTTAYTGVKSENAASLKDEDERAEMFDRLATVDEDNPLLSDYLTEASAFAAEVLRSFIASVSLAGETLTFSLNASDSFDDTLTPVVVNNLNAFLTASVTARWFRLSCREKAAEWETEATRRIDSVLATLCHRMAPRRKRTTQ
jgi:hypothetical protein